MKSQEIRRRAIPTLVGFLLATLWIFVGYWSLSERKSVYELTGASLTQLTASVTVRWPRKTGQAA